MDCCSRIKDRNGRLALGEEEVRRIWKEYFEDLYDTDTQEQVAVLMYDIMVIIEITTSEESRLRGPNGGESGKA